MSLRSVYNVPTDTGVMHCMFQLMIALRHSDFNPRSREILRSLCFVIVHNVEDGASENSVSGRDKMSSYCVPRFKMDSSIRNRGDNVVGIHQTTGLMKYGIGILA